MDARLDPTAEEGTRVRTGRAVMTELPVEVAMSGPFWTWVVPAVVFAIASAATWALYRHFADKPDE